LHWWRNLHPWQLPLSICNFVVPVIPYEFEILLMRKNRSAQRKHLLMEQTSHSSQVLPCVSVLYSYTSPNIMDWRMKLRTLSTIYSFSSCCKRDMEMTLMDATTSMTPVMMHSQLQHALWNLNR
jgi:hypothetical protein